MSQVRILSPHTQLASLVVAHLQSIGHTARLSEGEAAQLVLRVRAGVAVHERTAVLEALAPFTPRVEEDADLREDFELHLGSPGGLGGPDVRVATDSEEAAHALSEVIEEIGFKSAHVDRSFVSEPVLRYGGASRFARQAVRWLLARNGIPSIREEKCWGSDDNDVWVHAPHPALAALAPRERFEVTVRTDDAHMVAPLVASLRASGFHVSVMDLEPPSDGAAQKFRIDPGPFSRVSSSADLDRLRVAVTDLLSDRGVDTVRWPVVETSVERRGPRYRPPAGPTGESLSATIELPLSAFSRGELRPYEGRDADRYEVIVRTENEAHAEGLLRALREIGFIRPRFERCTDSAAQPRVTCGSLKEDPALRERVLDLARGALRTLTGCDAAHVESRGTSSDDERVVIELPVSGVADGTRRARALRNLMQYRILVHHESGDMTPLVRKLQSAGFRRTRVTTASDFLPSVQFGGAPDAVIEKVLGICAETIPAALERDNAWNPQDKDIFLWIPAEGASAASQSDESVESASADLAGWGHGVAGTQPAPFVETLATSVRVGSCTLARRPGASHPLAPRAVEFSHFCVDGKTAETLLHVAQAVAMREPCLLEGDTSTAKTSSVLYLASLLGQPVSRVNLHGQTDTGELVGRYVPNDGEGDSEWRWHDGVLLRAMREGHWLLLDEVNLAEPQILERFNSLLEREPSLVVTEHESERIGMGDIHPDFRLFATANPAEYAGRSALSPAWRDRWRAHRMVPTPGEREIEHFLRAAVFGSAPAIEAAGGVWPSAATAAAWPELAHAPGMASFLSALARFHVSVERAFASADAPGRSRRERYVVTRRNLLSVLDWLRSHGGTEQAMRGALVRYYLERLAPQDRAAVVRLLDAVGLGPNTWTVESGLRSVAA